MAQSYNLFDIYGIMWANIANGILANPAFGADRMLIGDFVDQVDRMTVAAMAKFTAIAGDMSTALPPASTFTGVAVNPLTKSYTPPPDAPPQKTFVPPTTFTNPDGTRIPLKK